MDRSKQFPSFLSIGYVNRPKTGLKPQCKCGSGKQCSRQGPIFREGDKVYGMCTGGHNPCWEKFCQKHHIPEWDPELSYVANGKCDALKMSRNDRFGINQYNVQRKLNLPADKKFNHISLARRKRANEDDEEEAESLDSVEDIDNDSDSESSYEQEENESDNESSYEQKNNKQKKAKPEVIVIDDSDDEEPKRKMCLRKRARSVEFNGRQISREDSRKSILDIQEQLRKRRRIDNDNDSGKKPKNSINQNFVVSNDHVSFESDSE
jgi:hypothetical protein